jgi:hypothetical protein
VLSLRMKITVKINDIMYQMELNRKDIGFHRHFKCITFSSSSISHIIILIEAGITRAETEKFPSRFSENLQISVSDGP